MASLKFLDELKKTDKEVRLKLVNEKYNILEKIKKLTFTNNGEVGGFIINELKATISNVDGDYSNLLGEEFELHIGFRYSDGTEEYEHIKNWIVVDTKQDKGSYDLKIVARDYTEKFNKELNYSGIYPVTVGEYIKEIANSAGLEIVDTEYPNKDFIIEDELFVGYDATYLDAVRQVAGATGTIAKITKDNKLKLAWYEPTDITLIDYKKIDKKESITYNTVVIGEGDVGDNVKRPETDVEEPVIFKIDNNHILRKNKIDGIEPLYQRINGFSYAPVKIETPDANFLMEAGNIINYTTQDGIEEAYINRVQIEYEGGLFLKCSSPELLDVKVDLKKAGTTKKHLERVKLDVDYINKEVNSKINILDQNNENLSQISQTIDDIELSMIEKIQEAQDQTREDYAKLKLEVDQANIQFQSSGYANLIKNSVLSIKDENNKVQLFPHWLGNTNYSSSIDRESILKAGISGQSFFLKKNHETQTHMWLYQLIDVAPYNSNESENTQLSFSFRMYKEAADPDCIISVSDWVGGDELNSDNYEVTHQIRLGNGDIADYKLYKIEGIKPKSSIIRISFVSNDPTTKFTDVMLNRGSKCSEWQQAAGELVNTNIKMSESGIKVDSSIYDGDYTIMSPIEFAGYSKLNGSLEKVFNLDKETLETYELFAKKGLQIPPLKLLPATRNGVKGWGIVKAFRN